MGPILEISPFWKFWNHPTNSYSCVRIPEWVPILDSHSGHSGCSLMKSIYCNGFQNGVGKPPSSRGIQQELGYPVDGGFSRANFWSKQNPTFSTENISLEVTMQHKIWNFGGQLYARIGIRPYIRQGGIKSELTVWLTHCADCGELFEVATAEQIPKYPTRRCPRHASKGRRVKTHVLWGKPVPLAELLDTTKQATRAKRTKRTAASILAGPSRRPDHINHQEERHGC